MAGRPTRSQFSWALYDWANSAFATTVIAGFFPLFFKQYWSGDAAATTSTFWLGAGNSAASLVIVLAAPLLGALADAGGLHKRLLGAFALLGIVCTGGLWLVGEGQWPWAIALYIVAILGFSGANVFYDAMLPDIAPARGASPRLGARLLARLPRRRHPVPPQRRDDSCSPRGSACRTRRRRCACRS